MKPSGDNKLDIKLIEWIVIFCWPILLIDGMQVFIKWAKTRRGK